MGNQDVDAEAQTSMMLMGLLFGSLGVLISVTPAGYFFDIFITLNTI